EDDRDCEGDQGQGGPGCRASGEGFRGRESRGPAFAGGIQFPLADAELCRIARAAEDRREVLVRTECAVPTARESDAECRWRISPARARWSGCAFTLNDLHGHL